jgi:hypothetical protein
VFEVSGSCGNPLTWLLLLKAIQMKTVEEIRADDFIIPSRDEALKVRRGDVWAVRMAALGDNIPGNVAEFLDTQVS